MKKIIFLLVIIIKFNTVSAQEFILNHIYYVVVTGTNEVSIQGNINLVGNLVI